MRHWITPPQRDNEYEAFAARILHYSLLLLLGIALTFTIFSSSPAQLIFIPVIVLVFGSAYFLLHRGRFRFASRIFLSGLWVVITLASFSINGIRNASLSSYAIVIIFAAVLLSDKAAIIVTVISIFSAIILAVGEVGGVLPLRTTPLFLADRFFQQVALFGSAGILLVAASRVIRRVYGRVVEHEVLLVERNHTLEVEMAERRRAESSLRISEEKYRLLFENIPVMTAVYAEDGEIVLLNHAAAQLLGGTPETLRGRNLRDVLTPGDAAIAIRDQAQVMKSGSPLIMEGDIKAADGRDVFFERHIMPLPRTDADVSSQVLVMTTDLTERYMAQQRERELVLAQEKNAFLTEFFRTLSHDLKTPLAVMTTGVYLLEQAQTAPQREERIAQINTQISLMDQYIQDMLTISRLEHLPLFSFESLNLNEMVAEVIEVLHPRMESRQLACQVNAQSDLPFVQGDQDQVRRLLINLIENAISYTPAGGQITVTTHTRDGGVALEIMDSGIGIEPDAMPYIFERFYRSPKAKSSVNNGTGLGLAIVQKIVEIHAASIDVNSQPGKGTTFSVQFPLEFPA